MLQKLRENLETLGHSPSRLPTRPCTRSVYKPLDEAGEMMSGDYEAVLELAATAARIKVAHAAMAAVDPTIYEFFHPWGRPTQTHRGHPRYQGRGETTQSGRYARTQCFLTGPDDLPMVHARQQVKAAALKTKPSVEDGRGSIGFHARSVAPFLARQTDGPDFWAAPGPVYRHTASCAKTPTDQPFDLAPV
jgi:hypothetical protein